MNDVIILCGVPGAGKSTLAKVAAAKKRGTVIVSADDYFPQDENRSKAHAACLRAFVQLVQTRATRVIVDNTNTTVVEIAPYAALATAFGYTLHVWIIGTPAIVDRRWEHMRHQITVLPHETPAWWPRPRFIPPYDEPLLAKQPRRRIEHAYNVIHELIAARRAGRKRLTGEQVRRRSTAAALHDGLVLPSVLSTELTIRDDIDELADEVSRAEQYCSMHKLRRPRKRGDD